MRKSSLLCRWNDFGVKLVHPHIDPLPDTWEDEAGAEAYGFYEHDQVFCFDNSRELHPNDNYEVCGLALKFAGLKTHEDICEFASKYGFLGIVNKPANLHQYPQYGRDVFETLSNWKYHISKVQRLVRLYRALCQRRKGYEMPIEGEIYNIVEFEDKSFAFLPRTTIRWTDGYLEKHLRIVIDTSLNEDENAVRILTSILSDQLHMGIFLGIDKVIPAKDSTIGFRLVEQKYTMFLLAAIYYDLWELITENRTVQVCSSCGLPMEKSGRKLFCSDACKQKNYRIRKGQKKRGF